MKKHSMNDFLSTICRQLGLGMFLLCAGFAIAHDRDISRYPYTNVAHASTIDSIHKGSYQNFFITEIQLGLDPTFSDEAQNLIRKSVARFMDRALAPQVLTCAFARANRDFPTSREDFERELLYALSPRYVDGLIIPTFLMIAQYNNDKHSVGIAYLNLFYDQDNPLPGYLDRHYFHIGLNSDHMGVHQQNPYAQHIDYWAGVIGHEMLHNLGYNHPNGYPGSFIREYGDCIWKNGLAYLPAYADSDQPSRIYEVVHEEMHDQIITKPTHR